MIELTDEVRFILGRPCFVCARPAALLRKLGFAIAERSEDEQAVVIHWMLSLYQAHGDHWRAEADAQLRRAQAAPASGPASDPVRPPPRSDTT